MNRICQVKQVQYGGFLFFSLTVGYVVLDDDNQPVKVTSCLRGLDPMFSSTVCTPFVREFARLEEIREPNIQILRCSKRLTTFEQRVFQLPVIQASLHFFASKVVVQESGIIGSTEKSMCLFTWHVPCARSILYLQNDSSSSIQFSFCQPWLVLTKKLSSNFESSICSNCDALDSTSINSSNTFRGSSISICPPLTLLFTSLTVPYFCRLLAPQDRPPSRSPRLLRPAPQRHRDHLGRRRRRRRRFARPAVAGGGGAGDGAGLRGAVAGWTGEQLGYLGLKDTLWQSLPKVPECVGERDRPEFEHLGLLAKPSQKLETARCSSFDW